MSVVLSASACLKTVSFPQKKKKNYLLRKNFSHISSSVLEINFILQIQFENISKFMKLFNQVCLV